MKMHTGLLILATTLCIIGCDRAVETTSTSNTVAVEVSDSAVTAKVMTALLSDDPVKRFDIAVVTTKGDVRLTGILDNQSQIDRAHSLARAVEGVHSIHDELTLK